MPQRAASAAQRSAYLARERERSLARRQDERARTAVATGVNPALFGEFMDEVHAAQNPLIALNAARHDEPKERCDYDTSATRTNESRTCATLTPASITPLVYVVDDFLTDEECDHLVALGQRRVKQLAKMRPLLEAMSTSGAPLGAPGKMIEWRACSAPDAVAHEVEERIGRLMGAAARSMAASSAQTLHTEGGEGAEAAGDGGGDGGGAAAAASRVPEGAHLDTHRLEHRWGTCIVYLTTLGEEDGGETCFPLATPGGGGGGPSAAAAPSPPDAVAAATLLTRGGYCHTQDALDDGRAPVVGAAERVLARSVRARACGLAVRPRKGTAAVFYTRDAHSAVDPSSFHFGAAVRTAGVEKWTCQIFKALPAAARESDGERVAFMRRVHPLSGAGGSAEQQQRREPKPWELMVARGMARGGDAAAARGSQL